MHWVPIVRPLRFALGVALALSLVAISLHAQAWELYSNEETGRAVGLDTAVKATSLFSRAPDDKLLFPERTSSVGLLRLRLGLDITLSETLDAELAYEHRAQFMSGAGGAGVGSSVLPSFAEAPYRLGQLDWQITANSGHYNYRHEVDRALLAWHPEWGEVTAGRQAIGLGRGVLFSAVDIFAPFSPTEVDREWRRGIDALRVEYRLSDTSSAELIGAFDERWDDSAILARWRGYMGDIDGELLIGKRGRDAMAAGVFSAAVLDAEIHAELALYHTPEGHPDGGLFGNDRLIPKLVVGTSYTFDVGNGLTVMGEYHYSGFGLDDVKDATTRLLDPDFQKRYLRGDSQTLSRQALGLQITYPINQTWSGAFMTLANPTDGSGLISPALIWDFSQNASLRMSAFLPWGSEPRYGQLQSEYGAASSSLFLQVSAYF